MKNILVLGLLTAGVLTAADTPPFKIRTKHDDDRVDVKMAKDQVVLSVSSARGISGAVIERQHEAWPAAIVLHLQLKGLENFQVASDSVKLAASVSSQDGKVRIWQGDDEQAPLDNRSPLWMEIRAVGQDGQPTTTIPLKDGYFHVRLPAALFDGNPKTITINWIDFYRN
jgi:hypothetical protein